MKTEATHHPVHVIMGTGLTLQINVSLVMKNVSDVPPNLIVFMNVLETELIYLNVFAQLAHMTIMVLLTVQLVPTDVLPVKVPLKIVLLVMELELLLVAVLVPSVLMNTLMELVKLVLTNVLIVIMMKTIVNHVLVTEYNIQPATVLQDITKMELTLIVHHVHIHAENVILLIVLLVVETDQ